MNKKRMAVMLLGSTVVFGGVLGFVQFRQHMIAQFFANMPKPVVTVAAEPAQMSEWRDSVSAVGTTAAVNGVAISAAAPGLVKEIAFESGQTVKAGDLLVRLDSDVEQSELRAAIADLELARSTAQRSRALLKNDAVSQATLDRAEAELKVKQARVEAIQAQIDKKSVYAPFSGALGVRKIDLGQYLQPGQAIVNLQDLSVMLVDFAVSQKDLELLAVGQSIRMTTDAWPGHGFAGTIQAIEPLIDAKTGMVEVQGRFPNKDGLLRPGMFAKVEVDRPVVAELVTVPASAVSYSLYGNSVFVVSDGADGDKEALRVQVELGQRRDGRVAVLKGLQPGAAVVTAGQVKLENGSKVKLAATPAVAKAE